MIFKQKFIKNKNILVFENPSISKTNISKFYKQHPFPNYNQFQNALSIMNLGNSNIFTKSLKEFIGFNKVVLEAGAGTSQLSLYLGLGTNNHIFALDTTFESLELGSNFANENNIKNITFVNSDIFNEVFIDDIFDFVICSGVLHHTKNPFLGFKKLVKNLKKDGYIIIGLYNKYGRLRTFIRQFIYKYISKNIAISLDPVLKKIDKKNVDKREAWIKDQYEHPIESSHSYDEILSWFKETNIEFINTIPNTFFNNETFNYFDKIQPRNFFIRIIEQINMIFSRQGKEGGLFIFIGKKI